ncbi:Uncharacterised protein [Mycobacteroides abscessus subsp. abscessus]|nr:Uncharacterised protein [Mycobacteroides abscessus subsp. abscessus]
MSPTVLDMVPPRRDSVRDVRPGGDDKISDRLDARSAFPIGRCANLPTRCKSRGTSGGERTQAPGRLPLDCDTGCCAPW